MTDADASTKGGAAQSAIVAQILAVTLCWSPALLSAAAAHAAPAAGCAATERRQFDFWIGHWTVYDTLNKSPGHSTIESVYGGCAIHESWSEETLVGGSITAFNPADHRWRQLWADDSGGMREFIGGLDAQGRMVLVASYPSTKDPARMVLDRMTYTPNKDGTVRQYSDASIDGGVTWKPLYDNIYRRAP